MSPQRLPSLVMIILVISLLGAAVSRNIGPKRVPGYWSDEATYHAMAHSIAFDGDIRYERRDLERVYELGYTAGPVGMFLVREPRSGNLYFAKAFVYPLAAAPFVRLFGDAGFYVLHALLLAAMLATGFSYLRRFLAVGSAAMLTTTYVLGSVATVYFFWMTPEWFNLALVYLATWLWMRHEPASGTEIGSFSGGAHWNSLAAAALYGVAIYSKPPNILLALPLLAWAYLAGHRRRAVEISIVLVLVLVVLFGLTWAAIGDWNYQGGDRKTFGPGYPFATSADDFDNTGLTRITELRTFTEQLPTPGGLAADLLYVLVGRNAGILIYMFPAALALGLYFCHFARRERRRFDVQGLLLAVWLLQIIATVVAIQGNWIGGGGTIGSRYFISGYALPFFAIPFGTGLSAAAASWLVWAAFLAGIVLNPFSSSFSPSRHTKAFPFTMLPIELTLLHNLPFNTEPGARRVPLDDPPTILAYFPDNNTFRGEPDTGGFWVSGGRRAEVILRTLEPIQSLNLRVRNGAHANRMRVRLGLTSVDRDLEANEVAEFSIVAPRGWIYEDTWLYRLVISSDTGFIPRYEVDGASDIRFLGLLVRPRIEPARVFGEF